MSIDRFIEEIDVVGPGKADDPVSRVELQNYLVALAKAVKEDIESLRQANDLYDGY